MPFLSLSLLKFNELEQQWVSGSSVVQLYIFIDVNTRGAIQTGVGHGDGQKTQSLSLEYI